MNYKKGNTQAGPANAGSTIRSQFDWETSNLSNRDLVPVRYVAIKKGGKMKKIIIVTSLVITICLLGCKEDTSTNSTPANIPVIANTTNAFAFTLVANSYTSNSAYDLTFSTDSLACSITVTNQTSGNASIKILDSTSSIVYSDSLLSNKVLAFTQANKGIPKSIKLAFNNYTGTLVFALSRNKK
jgi:hypothetical protein